MDHLTLLVFYTFTFRFRNITSKDYVFTSNFISELKAAENSEDYNLQNSSDPATKIVFNLRTYTGYDYLKWTEIVRIVYYSKQLINKIYRGMCCML